MCAETINDVAAVAERPFIVAASANAQVYMYTLSGALVGVLGQHEWDLEDTSTYQAARGVKPLPHLDPLDALYVAAQQQREQEAGASRA